MATAGFERGVSLRSPARFSEAANRLVHLWRPAPTTATRRWPMRSPTCGCAPRATGCTRTRRSPACSRADPIGAEASLNKIFWSEMDVRMHELALQILGPEAERMSGPASAGWTASCSRCPAPSMRAPTRSSATSSPTGSWPFRRGSDHAVLVHRGPAPVRREPAPAARQAVHPAHVREVWDDGSGHLPALWEHLAEHGRPVAAGRRGSTAVWAPPSSMPCSCSPSSGGRPCPARCSSTWWGRPRTPPHRMGPGTRRLPRRHRVAGSTAAPTCPTPRSADVILTRDGMLHRLQLPRRGGHRRWTPLASSRATTRCWRSTRRPSSMR
jgi:hypothetical protein